MPYLELVDAKHLRALQDDAEARLFFKKTVRMVEIEVFSYCNRVCWFCPNRDGSRLGTNQYMSETVYNSILSQLASIHYEGMITYSRYNEPLADRIIIRRMAEAKSMVPKANLHTNTNGDYLTAEYLAELYEAGLRGLNIQVYLKNHEDYDHDKIRTKAEFMLRKLGLPGTLTIDTPGSWLEYKLEYKDMAIRLYGRNFAENGTSRGDTVQIATDYVRTSPCLMPFWAVYIDFNGAMMPCCNLRSDIPEHNSAIVAVLKEHDSLFRVFAGEKLSEWRRSLLSFDEKTGLCRTCRFAIEKDDRQTRDYLDSVQLAAANN